jgi:hypothetical protein
MSSDDTGYEPQGLLTRAQEKKLDRQCKDAGLDKQTFLKQMTAKAQAEMIENSYDMHQAVSHPRDPVTGEPRWRSEGKYGPHFSQPKWMWWAKQRMWIERVYSPILLADTRHAMIGPMFTMWASCETR